MSCCLCLLCVSTCNGIFFRNKWIRKEYIGRLCVLFFILFFPPLSKPHTILLTIDTSQITSTIINNKYFSICISECVVQISLFFFFLICCCVWCDVFDDSIRVVETFFFIFFLMKVWWAFEFCFSLLLWHGDSDLLFCLRTGVMNHFAKKKKFLFDINLIVRKIVERKVKLSSSSSSSEQNKISFTSKNGWILTKACLFFFHLIFLCQQLCIAWFQWLV
jgi:hypothetical protein